MYSSVNTIWVLFGAALVFFMQAGFAMVETGFTRAKNAGNIIMKNLMDFCIGTPTFWIVGFGIMFGAGNGFFGKIGGIATEANYGSAMLPDGVPFWAFLIFQTVFCATSATIVSGAMAERTKFSSYCIYSFLISLIVYPVSGHWIWGGGFISQMGFHDFAGSCAVHMVGGVAAFIGAIILGPRIGKYGKDGKSKAIPGHNLTIGALGVFILWFCWFGFNGASTVSIAICDLNYIDTAVWRNKTMPEILRIIIYIMKKCSYRTSMRCDQDRLILKSGIVDEFFPEVLCPSEDILNVFPILRTFKVPWICKKLLHLRIQIFTRIVHAHDTFQDTEVDLLDPCILDHRNLSRLFLKDQLGCLSGSYERAGDTEVKRNIF